MKFHIGKRIIKTAVTLFLILLIYIFLLWIDGLFGIDSSSFKAPSNMYTPFFAGIAAVYATHRDKKSSIKQAKIRSFGSILGGYFGMIIVLIIEFIFINLLNLENTHLLLYYLFRYLLVTISLIPLIMITVKLKQVDAVFITCLTFLSVTISARNGGMPVLQFATNRVLSTLIGVGVSLLVNNYLFGLKKCNKDILFVTSLENNFVSKNDELSAFTKYKLNELFDFDIPLIFATTRTPMSFEYIFKDINIKYPMITMNGAAKYRFDLKRYSNVDHIEPETRLKIDEAIKVKNMNAFVYTVNDHVLHAYHNVLVNEGEKLFYKHRKHQNAYSFVRGVLPLDLFPSLYILIDTKERIEEFLEYCNSIKLNEIATLVTYKYRDINDKEYFYLRIYDNNVSKENYVNSIKKENNLNKLIVCGSGRTDINLLRQADLSMCLNTAPDYIKDEVDYVINGNAETVLRIFDKIYHSPDVNKTIEKFKNK